MSTILCNFTLCIGVDTFNTGLNPWLNFLKSHSSNPSNHMKYQNYKINGLVCVTILGSTLALYAGERGGPGGRPGPGAARDHAMEQKRAMEQKKYHQNQNNNQNRDDDSDLGEFIRKKAAAGARGSKLDDSVREYLVRNHKFDLKGDMSQGLGDFVQKKYSEGLRGPELTEALKREMTQRGAFGPVNTRQDFQGKRIEQGVHSGQLTKEEVKDKQPEWDAST